MPGRMQNLLRRMDMCTLSEKSQAGIFTHIPDWYRWERECVREELQNGTYHLEVPVEIYMLTNLKILYRVGEGALTHTEDGFHLTDAAAHWITGRSRSPATACIRITTGMSSAI